MSPSENAPAPQAAACPICGKPATAHHRPFCSARCRGVDLGRWLKGTYVVETDEPPDDDPGQDERG
jgi:uncharacterized protein